MGQGVDRTQRRNRTVLEIDLEVVGAVLRKGVGFGLAEDIRELVVLRRDIGEVRRRVGHRGAPSEGLSRRNRRQIEREARGSRQLARASEGRGVNKGNLRGRRRRRGFRREFRRRSPRRRKIGVATVRRRGPEFDAVRLPVNQRIVVGEPAVSQYGGDGLVERSDIKVDRHDFPGGEV